MSAEVRPARALRDQAKPFDAGRAGRLVCPRCLGGNDLTTVERLLGDARISRVAQLPDGEVEIDWTGSTEMDWDSSTTVGASCACGWHHDGPDWADRLVRSRDEPAPVDLDRVAAVLRERGVPNVRIEPTGTGCATLYAGPTHGGGAGQPRGTVAVGPGSFAGPGGRHARAWREELLIGPDDGGEAMPLAVPAWASDDELAAVIQAVIVLGAVQVVPPGAAGAALAALRLRAHDEDEPGDRTPYTVVDLHGASIGVKRRTGDLYVHIDTSQTPDKVLSVEINGGGEMAHPIR